MINTYKKCQNLREAAENTRTTSRAVYDVLGFCPSPEVTGNTSLALCSACLILVSDASSLDCIDFRSAVVCKANITSNHIMEKRSRPQDIINTVFDKSTQLNKLNKHCFASALRDQQRQD